MRSSCSGTSWTSTLRRSERVTDRPVASIVTAAWEAYGDHREIREIRDLSANVSTNSVHLLVLDDGHAVVAKRSSYGSYVHFRQDHIRIDEWIHRLRGTRYANLLAPVLQKNGEVFTYREKGEWVVFYGQQPFYDFLPPVLTEPQIESFAEEMALFHRSCLEISDRVRPTWQSLGSDIASLHDAIGSAQWRRERSFSDSATGFVRAHCDAFLGNADALGYHEWTKIPVLIDWNIGNFSVGMDGEGFKLFSRWDYDWFRIEPLGDDRCRFHHGERFRGIVLKPIWPQIEKRAAGGYDAFNAAFKKRCEDLHR